MELAVLPDTPKESVLAFYDLDTLSAALIKSNWSIDREIAMLVDLMVSSHATDGYLFLATQRQLRQTMLQIIKLSGAVTRVRAELASDGQSKLVAEHLKLAQAARQSALIDVSKLYTEQPQEKPALPYDETNYNDTADTKDSE